MCVRTTVVHPSLLDKGGFILAYMSAECRSKNVDLIGYILCTRIHDGCMDEHVRRFQVQCVFMNGAYNEKIFYVIYEDVHICLYDCCGNHQTTAPPGEGGGGFKMGSFQHVC